MTETTDAVEARIPDIARQAFADAYAETLRAGHPVLVRSGRYIERVHPDGTRERVKTIPPMVKVTKGARYALR